MEVVPAATPVAKPVVEIVAVAGVPEVQVTLVEMSDIEPSLNVPVAVNCCVLPTFRLAGVAGVTAMEESVFPPGGFIPLQPARTPKANADNTSAAKRRGRDFISPPRERTKSFWRHTDLWATLLTSTAVVGLGNPTEHRTGPIRVP